jgi:hypothetical protein
LAQALLQRLAPSSGTQQKPPDKQYAEARQMAATQPTPATDTSFSSSIVQRLGDAGKETTIGAERKRYSEFGRVKLDSFPKFKEFPPSKALYKSIEEIGSMAAQWLVKLTNVAVRLKVPDDLLILKMDECLSGGAREWYQEQVNQPATMAEFVSMFSATYVPGGMEQRLTRALRDCSFTNSDMEYASYVDYAREWQIRYQRRRVLCGTTEEQALKDETDFVSMAMIDFGELKKHKLQGVMNALHGSPLDKLIIGLGRLAAEDPVFLANNDPVIRMHQRRTAAVGAARGNWHNDAPLTPPAGIRTPSTNGTFATENPPAVKQPASEQGPRKYCPRCGRTEHEGECTVRCFRCHKRGHVRSNCPESRKTWDESASQETGAHDTYTRGGRSRGSRGRRGRGRGRGGGGIANAAAVQPAEGTSATPTQTLSQTAPGGAPVQNPFLQAGTRTGAVRLLNIKTSAARTSFGGLDEQLEHTAPDTLNGNELLEPDAPLRGMAACTRKLNAVAVVPQEETEACHAAAVAAHLTTWPQLERQTGQPTPIQVTPKDKLEIPWVGLEWGCR